MEILPPPTPSAFGVRRSARRCLTFGSTAATVAAASDDASPARACRETRDASDAFVHQLLAQMAASYRAKWEFDFTRGEPLPSSAESRFEYTLIDSAVLPPLYATECVPPASPSLVDATTAAAAAENAALADIENASPVQQLDSNVRAPLIASFSPIANETSPPSSSSSTSIVCPSFGEWSPTRKLRKPTLIAHTTPKKSARQSAIGGKYFVDFV